MAVFTKRAAEVFAPTAPGGAARGADMGEAQTWGTEVENKIEEASTDTDLAVAAEAATREAADALLQANINSEAATRAAADVAMQAELDAAEATFLTGQKPLIGSVRVLTTADTATATAMENGDTLDGVVLATGDRVGKAYNGATGAASNGIWIVQASGAAVRATDANTDAELRNGSFYVDEGTYQGELWAVKNTSAITVDTTAIVIQKARDPVGYEAEVITARDDYATLDTRLDVMETGRVDDGDVTPGVHLLSDLYGYGMVVYDPVTGPALLTGDRHPNLPVLKMWIIIGQSNAAVTGVAMQPGMNVVPTRPNRALMFDAIGTVGQASTAVSLSSVDLRKIVAARETTGESFVTGFITQLLAYEDANRLATAARLFVNVAVGGAGYTGLKKTTVPYANAVYAVQEAVDRYKNVVVEGIIVAHGEADSSAGVSAATYQGYMEEWSTDFNLDLSAITGQTETIPMLMVSMPILATDGTGTNVQDAQLALHVAALASSANDQVYVGATAHQHGYGDTLHVGPVGHSRIGAELGQSFAEYYYGSGPNILRMTGATIDGNVIVVATNAGSNLAADTGLIDTPANSGFVVTNAGGTTQTISSVAVSGTTVRITMAGTPVAGWIVKYARVKLSVTAFGPGGWGNIRDSSTTKMALSSDRILYRWLLPAQITVT